MRNKNIILNNTLEQYNKKYKNLNYNLLKFTKKEVEDFDKVYKTEKNFLLSNRNWWLIGDTYYEIPKPIRFTWFRNLSSAIQIGTCALLGCAVVTAAVVPSVLILSQSNKPQPGPEPTPTAGEVELEETFENNEFTVGFKSIKKEGDRYVVNIPSTIKHEGVDYPVKHLAEDAFNGQVHEECKKISKVTLPNTIAEINKDAFSYSGITEMTIPNSIKSIDKFSFVGCNNLKTLVIENGNKNYDSRNNCNAIIETSTNELLLGCAGSIIPNTVTSIASSAFAENSGLKSIHIPSSVKTIGSMAFSLDINSNEGGLESVTFDDNSPLLEIEQSTFANQSALTSITLPASIESIGHGAFVRTGLTQATIKGDETKWFIGDEKDPIDLNGKTPEEIATLLKSPLKWDRRREVSLNYYIADSLKNKIQFITEACDQTVEAHQTTKVKAKVRALDDIVANDLEISFVVYFDGTIGEQGTTKVSKKVYSDSYIAMTKDTELALEFSLDVGKLINSRVYPTILISTPANK